MKYSALKRRAEIRLGPWVRDSRSTSVTDRVESSFNTSARVMASPPPRFAPAPLRPRRALAAAAPGQVPASQEVGREWSSLLLISPEAQIRPDPMKPAQLLPPLLAASSARYFTATLD